LKLVGVRIPPDGAGPQGDGASEGENEARNKSGSQGIEQWEKGLSMEKRKKKRRKTRRTRVGGARKPARYNKITGVPREK